MRKYLALMATGGLLYVILELTWRGRSHWTMFLLGGICFAALGLINEILPWSMALWKQILIGTGIITALEFLTGCVVNLCLGWNIWDYSHGIVLDDWLRYWWWGEERPKYKMI